MAGLGILFVGVSFMYEAASALTEDAPVWSDAFGAMGANPFLGIIGRDWSLRQLFQSSGASVGILQALAMCGMVSWNSGILYYAGTKSGVLCDGVVFQYRRSPHGEKGGADPFSF